MGSTVHSDRSETDTETEYTPSDHGKTPREAGSPGDDPPKKDDDDDKDKGKKDKKRKDKKKKKKDSETDDENETTKDGFCTRTTFNKRKDKPDMDKKIKGLLDSGVACNKTEARI